MTLLILGLAVFILYRLYRRANPHKAEDSLGAVVGKATHYAECPVCSKRDSQEPRKRGEVIVRGGFYVVRQYHVCSNCDARALWHRRLDQFVWTVNRSGVSGFPYRSNG